MGTGETMAELSKDMLIEMEIVGFTAEGAGVGRYQGMAVFVPGALPGETVAARVVAIRKNFTLARMVKLIKAHPGRIKPPCPTFEHCGGCNLQHTNYLNQLGLKTAIVREALRRIGKIETEVKPTLGAESPYHYRNRMGYHVAREGDSFKLGFFVRQSKRFIEAEDCMLAATSIQKLAMCLPRSLGGHAAGLEGLRDVVVRCNSDESVLLLTLVADKPLQAGTSLAADLMAAEPRLKSVWECAGQPVYGIYGEQWRLLQGEKFFPDTLCGRQLLLSPATFIQVNPAQTQILYQLVCDYAALTGSESVLDLYCGAGIISLCLADQAAQVIGVENYPPAVENAERNAELNDAANCRFICGAAERILPELAADGVKADVAVLDPPRAGCDTAVLYTLCALGPAKIIYVSCDPATLARDMRILCEGGFVTTAVQPVDMFPQTGHVETVVLLEKEC